MTPVTVTFWLQWQFLGQKRISLYWKFRLQWHFAYSDTFWPSQHCHCKRGGLYHENLCAVTKPWITLPKLIRNKHPWHALLFSRRWRLGDITACECRNRKSGHRKRSIERASSEEEEKVITHMAWMGNVRCKKEREHLAASIVELGGFWFLGIETTDDFSLFLPGNPEKESIFYNME